METKTVTSLAGNKYKIQIPLNRNNLESIQLFDKETSEYKSLSFNELDTHSDIDLDGFNFFLKIKTSLTKSTLFMTNGDIYEGETENYSYNGKGILTYANGDSYKGRMKMVKKDGYGELIEAVGKTYKGEFKDDKKHGQGTMHLLDNSIYTGEFERGYMHGNGTLVLPNQSVHKVVFNRGVLENPFLLEEKKKDQIVLFINHKSYFKNFNYRVLSKRYKDVKLLKNEGSMNFKFLKKLITLPTKGTKKENKLKFFILEHASSEGNLANEEFIINTLKATLKEVIKYNNLYPEDKIKNIDIVLNTCFGSQVVYKNKKFKNVLKEFTKVKIAVKVSTSDENSKISDLISNSKNVISYFSSKKKNIEKYVINEFKFNEESDFDTITPSRVKVYNSFDCFLADEYDGKAKKSNGVNYDSFSLVDGSSKAKKASLETHAKKPITTKSRNGVRRRGNK